MVVRFGMSCSKTNSASARSSLAAIRFLAAADLLIAAVDDILLLDSLRIAHKEHLALYDAVFIALAARLDAELVTADRRQAATKCCRVRLIEG